MTLKNAALLALIGTILMTALLVWTFVFNFLRKWGAAIHFNLQSVDNCPFLLHVLDWGLLIEIQATAGIG
jgi:hypothetical protein